MIPFRLRYIGIAFTTLVYPLTAINVSITIETEPKVTHRPDVQKTSELGERAGSQLHVRWDSLPYLTL